MTAPGFFITADNYWIRSVHEQHLIRNIILIHIIQYMDECIKELAAACINHQHYLTDMAAGMLAQLNKLWNKDRWQVIYHKIPEVFHITAGLCFTSARHPRHNNQPELLILRLL